MKIFLSGTVKQAENLDLPSTRQGAVLSVGANELCVAKYSEPILRMGKFEPLRGENLPMRSMTGERKGASNYGISSATYRQV